MDILQPIVDALQHRALAAVLHTIDQCQEIADCVTVGAHQRPLVIEQRNLLQRRHLANARCQFLQALGIVRNPVISLPGGVEVRVVGDVIEEVFPHGDEVRAVQELVPEGGEVRRVHSRPRYRRPGRAARG